MPSLSPLPSSSPPPPPPPLPPPSSPSTVEEGEADGASVLRRWLLLPPPQRQQPYPYLYPYLWGMDDEQAGRFADVAEVRTYRPGEVVPFFSGRGAGDGRAGREDYVWGCDETDEWIEGDGELGDAHDDDDDWDMDHIPNFSTEDALYLSGGTAPAAASVATATTATTEGRGVRVRRRRRLKDGVGDGNSRGDNDDDSDGFVAVVRSGRVRLIPQQTNAVRRRRRQTSYSSSTLLATKAYSFLSRNGGNDDDDDDDNGQDEGEYSYAAGAAIVVGPGTVLGAESALLRVPPGFYAVAVSERDGGDGNVVDGDKDDDHASESDTKRPKKSLSATMARVATTTTTTKTTSGSGVECYVVPTNVFRNYVLQSEKMVRLFAKYARTATATTTAANAATAKITPTPPYVTMDDFVRSLADREVRRLFGAGDSGNGLDPLRTAATAAAPTLDILAADALDGIVQLIQRGPTAPSSSSSSLGGPRIDLADFCVFHLLASARPCDPEVDIAFVLMDRGGKGLIDVEDFEAFLRARSAFSNADAASTAVPFDLDSDFVHRHFGRDGRRTIQHDAFSQFLSDFRRELGRQAFSRAANAHGAADGSLDSRRFADLLRTPEAAAASGRRLPEGVADRLDSLCRRRDGGVGGGNFSDAGMSKRFRYSDFLAYQDVIAELPGVCSLIRRACELKGGPVSPDDMMIASRLLGLGEVSMSRQQVAVVFQLFDPDCKGLVSAESVDGMVGTRYVLPPIASAGDAATFASRATSRFGPMGNNTPTQAGGEYTTGSREGLLGSIGQYLEQFTIGAFAVCVGVTSLYPLDLVKTRMQNQRFAVDGISMYRSSWECFVRTINGERVIGLYRGLLPQLLGAVPEKAIKISVNDVLRKTFAVSDAPSGEDSIRFLLELLSGGCAGACQVLVVNPLEITKIRLQIQGETARILAHAGRHVPIPKSATTIAKELGLAGLYNGASACLLRDVPFSAIYFAAFASCKEWLMKREKGMGISASKGTSNENILISGIVAGVPASFLTTPADVVKTRLQVVARDGEMAYSGIGDCIKKIYRHEGFSAFFKGTGARILHIAPQFGISLLAYEKLSQLFGNNASPAQPPVNAPIHPWDYRSAFSSHSGSR